jgi:hypothetical protein
MPNMVCIWGLCTGIRCLLFASTSTQALWTFQSPFQWVLWAFCLHEPITYLNLIHRACSQLQVQYEQLDGKIPACSSLSAEVMPGPADNTGSEDEPTTSPTLSRLAEYITSIFMK